MRPNPTHFRFEPDFGPKIRIELGRVGPHGQKTCPIGSSWPQIAFKFGFNAIMYLINPNEPNLSPILGWVELLFQIILLYDFWTIFGQSGHSVYSSARIYHENYFEVRLTVIRPLCKKLLFCNNKGLSMSVYLNLFRLNPDAIRTDIRYNQDEVKNQYSVCVSL